MNSCGETEELHYDNKLSENIIIQSEATDIDSMEEIETEVSEDIFCLSGAEYFPKFEGEWIVAEYIGDANDSQPKENYTEEYYTRQEEITGKMIDEYLGNEYRIEIDNIKYFCPMTELGYILEDENDLFICTRFAHLNFPMTPPYVGVSVYFWDKDEDYNFIMDDNGILLIQIKYSFFKLERKSDE